MPQFEYKRVYIMTPTHTANLKDTEKIMEIKRREMEVANELGKSGWELITINENDAWFKKTVEEAIVLHPEIEDYNPW